jgi:hypothetical protein
MNVRKKCIRVRRVFLSFSVVGNVAERIKKTSKKKDNFVVGDEKPHKRPSGQIGMEKTRGLNIVFRCIGQGSRLLNV